MYVPDDSGEHDARIHVDSILGLTATVMRALEISAADGTDLFSVSVPDRATPRRFTFRFARLAAPFMVESGATYAAVIGEGGAVRVERQPD